MNTVKQSNQLHCLMLKYFIIAFISAISPISLANESLMIHKQIENNIYDYIKTQVEPSPYNKTEIIIANIDRRKQLPLCENSLELKIMGKSGLQRTNTINVSCPDKWRIFVPVTVNTLTPVAIAKQNFSIGEELTSANIAIKYIDISRVVGQTVNNVKHILGTKSQRYIQSGRPITLNLICMVCKNEQVTITALNGNLKIKSSGISLSSGSKGEKISIKNNSSGRIIEATVVSIGHVEIKL